ncbi:hypothetical protein Dip518_001075 [Parelusimicrobium proximum]|uniref:hypothetical protein n=1 Tax=Parelusimicrobium proximum TaxID=3228953 RepID=UPI003D177D5D
MRQIKKKENISAKSIAVMILLSLIIGGAWAYFASGESIVIRRGALIREGAASLFIFFIAALASVKIFTSENKKPQDYPSAPASSSSGNVIILFILLLLGEVALIGIKELMSELLIYKIRAVTITTFDFKRAFARVDFIFYIFKFCVLYIYFAAARTGKSMLGGLWVILSENKGLFIGLYGGVTLLFMGVKYAAQWLGDYLLFSAIAGERVLAAGVDFIIKTGMAGVFFFVVPLFFMYNLRFKK